MCCADAGMLLGVAWPSMTQECVCVCACGRSGSNVTMPYPIRVLGHIAVASTIVDTFLKK